MFYVTGDTHGNFVKIMDFCYKNKLTKEDVIIILGDAGINYNGDRDECLKLNLKRSIPCTLFMIHGNHEMRPYETGYYEEKEWNGGIVYVEEDYPNLLFAKDGEIYDFGGKKAVAIGGAYSIDKYYRLERGWKWFPSEQPDDEIKRHVEERLKKEGWKVDYVLTHTCPLKYEPTDLFLEGIDQSTVDKSTEIWLSEIAEKLNYERWYFGHFHGERQYPDAEMLYENFSILGSGKCENNPKMQHQ